MRWSGDELLLITDAEKKAKGKKVKIRFTNIQAAHRRNDLVSAIAYTDVHPCPLPVILQTPVRSAVIPSLACRFTVLLTRSPRVYILPSHRDECGTPSPSSSDSYQLSSLPITHRALKDFSGLGVDYKAVGNRSVLVRRIFKGLADERSSYTLYGSAYVGRT